ncbi:MAG: hypothetical protein H3C30_09285 [Candidatus Hydrogenedentes bacterium]|nr:hypothetical protein [Candidatus Hydrogenedentota bacterium]
MTTQNALVALVADIKNRIETSQTRAMLVVNAELVHLYWDIGWIIAQRQRQAGWGASVIPRLARELHNELPDIKGFSERNLKLMVQFAGTYPEAFSPAGEIGQPSVARSAPSPIGQLPVAQITLFPKLHFANQRTKHYLGTRTMSLYPRHIKPHLPLITPAQTYLNPLNDNPLTHFPGHNTCQTPNKAPNLTPNRPQTHRKEARYGE